MIGLNSSKEEEKTNVYMFTLNTLINMVMESIA